MAACGLATALLLPLVLGGCDEQENAAAKMLGGNPGHGVALIRQLGCGSCHEIPGIAGADGLVGPPLDRIGRRVYLAGMVRNTADNMIAWLRDPQSIVPGNVMPDMNIDEQGARDIAAYLYTLK